MTIPIDKKFQSDFEAAKTEDLKQFGVRSISIGAFLPLKLKGTAGRSKQLTCVKTLLKMNNEATINSCEN